MSDLKKRINVTLRPDVWRKGKKLAKREGRSLSNELEILIEREDSRVREKSSV